MHRPLLLTLSMILLAGCGEPPADEPVEDAAAITVATPIADPTPCTVDGMHNCARTGNVLIGGQPSPEALEALAAQGITTVVSTRGEGEIDWDERAAVEALGMRFVQIPMASPVTGITDEQVAALDEVLSGTEEQILLHCGSGNRVSGLWGAWLAAMRDYAPEEALRLAELAGMRSVRPRLEERLGVGAETR